MSCNKAREALELVEIVVEVDAKKEALQAEEVWDRLQRVEKIIVAKGQKVQTYVPDLSVKDDLMHDVLGRTGNLRAPTVQVGNTYYVGYNENIYEELMT
ncbi:MAG: ArsC family (seleno)protein [Desulfocapsaceae bacterium]|nr:ArsC family (seleno)protein [Desulfocapsaceae bacterium]